ncbi:MAG: hypothetical protein OXG55_00315 [bacterium]|nr:hypothetical protein [bacterium]
MKTCAGRAVAAVEVKARNRVKRRDADRIITRRDTTDALTERRPCVTAEVDRYKIGFWI